MSHRPPEEDDRPSKRIKCDDGSRKQVNISSGCNFSHLYCGIVCVIQSYLRMTELVQLSKVSHHYRDVAIGNLNPAGLYRLGKDISYVSFDIVQKVKDERAAEASLSSSSQSSTATEAAAAAASSSQQSDTDRVLTRQQSFNLVFNGETTPSILNEMSAILPPLPTSQLLAMIPAPSYGAPASARHIATPFDMDIQVVGASAVITRHVQELSIRCDFRSQTFASLLLRLPYLQSLDIMAWQSDDVAITNFSLHTLQFPPALRSFSLDGGYINPSHDVPRAFEQVISLLPLQCLQLQEFTLGNSPTESVDLSPLLRLPNLTKLTVAFYQQDNMSDHQAIVFRQLTRLKYLRLVKESTLLYDFPDIVSCLPIPPNALEEFHMPDCCGQEQFTSLANMAPQVKVLSALDCELINHSILETFRNVQKFAYSQVMMEEDREFGRNEDDIDLQFQSTDLAERCFEAHGSLENHISHVISVLSKFSALTDLRLGDLYSSPSCRAVVVNAEYFASRGMKHDRPLLYWPQTAADFPTSSSGAFTSLVPYTPLPKDSPNSLYRLTALLPHLTKISIVGYSAWQLPSLSFVSHLPQLADLEIEQAIFLPVESLYDLRAVASTLKRLVLIKCFSVDAQCRYVYLLHDVLKPLQFSSPVTQAATINFPAHMRKSMETDSSSMDSDSDPIGSNLPGVTMTLQNDAWRACETPEPLPILPILPRISGYYAIRKLPPPKIRNVLAWKLHVARVSEYISEETEPDEIALFKANRWRSHKTDWIPRHPLAHAPFRPIFDSFTVQAPPVDENDAKILISRLLPNVEFCEIELIEPHMQGVTFWYDRSKLPRVRIEAKGSDFPGTSTDLLKRQNTEERQVIQAMYNVELNYTDIKGMDYWALFESSDLPTKKYRYPF